MGRSLIVSKFGGTSMGNYESMLRSAKICTERGSSLIVVSATSGTTDKLVELAKLASQGNQEACDKIRFGLKERHDSLLKEIPHHQEIKNILHGYYTELDLLVQNVSLLRELTPKAHDHILSLGERMSSLIFREVLKSQAPDKKVHLLDARTIIRTDSNFGKATPQIEVIERSCEMHLNFDPEHIYVTQGFIGSDLDGNTTILGRGGSDYSAALFAEAVHADVLEIWTDVAGIATTDPRICATAKIISELSYHEAGEMAQYGAKILHPATIAPAVRKSIPVFVGSTFEKDLPGTWIRSEVESKPAVRAITKRSHQTLLTITTPKMLNTWGFMGLIFNIFGKHRISVDCVTTSEISIAISVDQNILENEVFLKDLKEVGTVEIEPGYSLISLIGNELFNQGNLAKNIFSTLDETKIRMMSLGASSYNLNFLVKEEDSKGCIQKLHRGLIEEVR